MLPFVVYNRASAPAREPNSAPRMAPGRQSLTVELFQPDASAGVMPYPVPTQIAGSDSAQHDGIARQWRPKADLEQLQKTVAILTAPVGAIVSERLVSQCLAEIPCVAVVDGDGSVRVSGGSPAPKIEWTHPKSWAASINALVRRLTSQRTDVERFVILSDVVELSREFFAGIIGAEQQTGASIVASSYSGPWLPQQAPSARTARQFSAQPRHRAATLCDARCFSVHRRALRGAGFRAELRTRTFAVADLCLRARMRGQTVAITHSAFADCGTRSWTQNDLFDCYPNELEAGLSAMAEMWGRQWRTDYESTTLPRFVVYTCRDDLAPPRDAPASWQFVCFSNAKNLSCAGWDVRAMRKSIDWYKLRPDRVFPGEARSIWIGPERRYLPEWSRLAWHLGSHDMALFGRGSDVLVRRHRRRDLVRLHRRWWNRREATLQQLVSDAGGAVGWIDDGVRQQAWFGADI